MDEFNLMALESLGLQLFELIVSFTRTLFHLVTRPRLVFESLAAGVHRPAGASQEVYGDGVIGYTSPVLFAITSLLLQLVIDWSAHFYSSASGWTEADLSFGSIAYSVEFLVFAVVAALVANRALGSTAPTGGLRNAFYVSCYGAGFGIFRTLAFTVAVWCAFAGTTARGREPGILLAAGALFSVVGGAFLLWQLVVLGHGFVRVLGLGVRKAVWTVALCVVIMAPVLVVQTLVFGASEVVVWARLAALELTVRDGRPDLALHHVVYLERAEGFEGSKASLALRKTQLEAQVYRRWLPAYRLARQRLALIEQSVSTTGVVTSTAEQLDEVRRGLRISSLAKQRPTAYSDDFLDDEISRSQARLLERLLDLETSDEWPFPYPANINLALSDALEPARRGDQEVLLHALSRSLTALDVGILSMEQRLRALPQRLRAETAAVAPAFGFDDPLLRICMALSRFL